MITWACPFIDRARNSKLNNGYAYTSVIYYQILTQTDKFESWKWDIIHARYYIHECITECRMKAYVSSQV